MQNLRPAYNPCIDWLSYQLPRHEAPTEMLPGHHLEFERANRPGRYGYKYLLTYLAMEVWLEHAQSNRPRVDLSGRGCRDLEAVANLRAGSFDWGAHLAWLLGRGAIMRRVDFTIDVYGAGLSIQYIVEACQAGRTRSRWDVGAANEIKRIAPGADRGHTLYVGSKKSESYLCAYDKRAERGLGEGAEEWTRLEWRTSGNVAGALVRTISEHGMRAGIGAFRQYFDIVTSEGGTDAVWDAALQSAVKRPLHVPRRGGTADATEMWIERTVAASLNAAYERRGESGFAWLAALLEEGAIRASAKHRQLAATPMPNVSHETFE